jgi:transposase
MEIFIKRKEPRMKEFIAFDCHKRYTLVEREETKTAKTKQCRVEHAHGAIEQCLRGRELGTPVAVEASGNWYWIVDEIERAGLKPLLVHPRKAKLMRGMINKTDKLDVHGLNQLQRAGTLPTVWIPPRELRDLRELTRTRMVLGAQRTRLKNRIQATLNKYGWVLKDYSDPFGKKARVERNLCIGHLPPQTAYVTGMLLKQLDELEGQIADMEKRIRALAQETPVMNRLMTLPGIGWILAVVIVLEVGEIHRFPSAQHLASYSGTTPRVQQSGDKTRYGRLRPDVNHYLRWAFIEAAHSVCLNQACHPHRHVTKLYQRLRGRKGHAKAVGAVARHLAEATYHVWNTGEPYRDPALKQGRSTGV